MANLDTPFGLRAIRHKSGAPYNGAYNNYSLKADDGTAVFVGDVVIRNGTANLARIVQGTASYDIGTLPEIVKATLADGNQVTGVIVGFDALPTNLDLKHNPASTERVAHICDDPEVIFEVQANGAVPAASVNLNAILIQDHAGVVATGLSGLELDTTGTVPSANASYMLVIRRMVNREDNTPNSIHNKLEVLLSPHTEAHGSNAATDGILGL